MAAYGARELCHLELEDIELDRPAIKVRDGKGERTSVVYISEDAVETLHLHLVKQR